MMRIVTFVGLMLLSSHAIANNAACWSTDGKTNDPERPDITCIPLNESFLMRLKNATRKQLAAVMGGSGRLLDGDGKFTLHYISNYGMGPMAWTGKPMNAGFTGFVNFTFSKDRVALIVAEFDAPNGGYWSFIWSPNFGTCSDRPGSGLQTCIEMIKKKVPD